MILVNYKRLTATDAELCQDIAEHAKTIEDCWKELDSRLARDRITQATYDEIKVNVTFEDEA